MLKNDVLIAEIVFISQECFSGIVFITIYSSDK